MAIHLYSALTARGETVEIEKHLFGRYVFEQTQAGPCSLALLLVGGVEGFMRAVETMLYIFV